MLEARHPVWADIPLRVERTGVTSLKAISHLQNNKAMNNKAMGGICSPMALPAPDIKLAYAIRRLPA